LGTKDLKVIKPFFRGAILFHKLFNNSTTQNPKFPQTLRTSGATFFKDSCQETAETISLKNLKHSKHLRNKQF